MRANPDASSPTDHGPVAASSSSETRSDDHDTARASMPARRTNILPRFLTRFSAANQLSAPSNDGVFANLAAKPERGDKNEDLPPVSWTFSFCAPLCPVRMQILISVLASLTKKPPPMRHLRTGRLLYSPPAFPQMRYTLMDYPLAPYSHLCGMR